MTKFMWFQLVSIVIITMVLVGVCVVEDILVTTALENAQNYCYEIETKISENGGIRNNDVCTLVDNLEYHWLDNEAKLCYVVNHKSIQEIGVEVTKLKTYIQKEDDREFMVSLNLIKLYTDQYQHFMGASIHNIL